MWAPATPTSIAVLTFNATVIILIVIHLSRSTALIIVPQPLLPFSFLLPFSSNPLTWPEWCFLLVPCAMWPRATWTCFAQEAKSVLARPTGKHKCLKSRSSLAGHNEPIGQKNPLEHSQTLLAPPGGACTSLPERNAATITAHCERK